MFPQALRNILSALMFTGAAAMAQDSGTGGHGAFQFHGYATINAYKFDWETDPSRRAQTDMERFSLEPVYRASDWLRFEGELELEHGGTGATMEFDKFEEAGEYEVEIEKGGEVSLEALSAVFEFMPELNLRIGHFFLPMGTAWMYDEPTEFYTVQRSESETALLPSLWHETGVEISGMAGMLRYQAQMINGLDAAGFSSANWIAPGHQGRFETVNAENLAWSARVDLLPCDGCMVGMAGYVGNSADNRTKNDLHVSANVGIAQTHGEFARGPYIARGMLLYGRLGNADAVSRANRNLSNNLNVKRTPVAKSALGGYAEAGVDILALRRDGFGLYGGRRKGQRLDVYGRYDYYDSMRQTDAGFFNNPRWERETWSGGVNYTPDPHVVLKSQYAHRVLGLSEANVEDTWSLGLGLVF